MRNLLIRIEDVALSVLMIVLVLDVTAQVLARYVMLQPLSWTEELARYTFIYVTFFGSAAAIRDRSHVSIDVCVKLLPLSAQLIISLAADALIIASLAYLFYWSILSTLKVKILHSVAMQISFSFIYVIVPISLLLMILRIVIRIIEDVTRFKRGTWRMEETAASIA
jgi:TRAP-type transport system small permease protein